MSLDFNYLKSRAIAKHGEYYALCLAKQYGDPRISALAWQYAIDQPVFDDKLIREAIV
jgi:hypothetical protein